MNAKKLLLVTSFVALSGSVFANDLLPFTEADQFTSSKTRAEVKAEAIQKVRSEQIAAHGDLLESNPFVTTSKMAVKSPRAPSDGVDSAKNQHGADDHKAGS